MNKTISIVGMFVALIVSYELGRNRGINECKLVVEAYAKGAEVQKKFDEEEAEE